MWMTSSHLTSEKSDVIIMMSSGNGVDHLNTHETMLCEGIMSLTWTIAIKWNVLIVKDNCILENWTVITTACSSVLVFHVTTMCIIFKNQI